MVNRSQSMWTESSSQVSTRPDLDRSISIAHTLPCHLHDRSAIGFHERRVLKGDDTERRPGIGIKISQCVPLSVVGQHGAS